jgi:hypothetical protein
METQASLCPRDDTRVTLKMTGGLLAPTRPQVMKAAPRTAVGVASGAAESNVTLIARTLPACATMSRVTTLMGEAPLPLRTYRKLEEPACGLMLKPDPREAA